MLPKLSSRPASPPAGLLSSTTRIDPGLRHPASHCCRDGKHRSGYETCPDDPRVVRRYAARESIAISRGQNDTGMFETQPDLSTKAELISRAGWMLVLQECPPRLRRWFPMARHVFRHGCLQDPDAELEQLVLDPRSAHR